MWSIMSRDFDNKILASECFNKIINNIYPGAIILFHDTVQASDNLFKALPDLLEYLERNDYTSVGIK